MTSPNGLIVTSVTVLQQARQQARHQCRRQFDARVHITIHAPSINAIGPMPPQGMFGTIGMSKSGHHWDGQQQATRY